MCKGNDYRMLMSFVLKKKKTEKKREKKRKKKMKRKQRKRKFAGLRWQIIIQAFDGSARVLLNFFLRAVDAHWFRV